LSQSKSDGRSEWLGHQQPRIVSLPQPETYSTSLGIEAVDLAKVAGLILDPWQQWYTTHSLGETPEGRFAAFECGLDVSRQNGKGALLESRELTGLFLIHEELIIHSAHEFATSLEAFRRLLFLIESTPDLDRQVLRVSRSHGDEGIEVRGGSRIRFRTRTSGGGRGFTADCVIFDEAMIISEAMQGAIIPTLSSIENPQVWYTGSAGSEDGHRDGKVFAKVRDRAIRGTSKRLFYAEWSADEDAYQAAEEAGPEALDNFLDDPHNWCTANPSLGIRITREFIEGERDALTPTNFAVERLGVGKWPDLTGDAGGLIAREQWKACGNTGAAIGGALTFAIDVAPGFKSASIAVAGRSESDPNKWCFETVWSEKGSAWLVPKVIELKERHKTSQWVYDPRSPVVSMVGDLERKYVSLLPVTAQQFTAACGTFIDAIERELAEYPYPQPEVDAAIRGAGIRNVGDVWVWSRRNSDVDISPLVTATLALWGAQNVRQPSIWSIRDMVNQIQTEAKAEEAEPEPVIVNPVTGKPIPTVKFTRA
jgi:hypothetical protein